MSLPNWRSQLKNIALARIMPTDILCGELEYESEKFSEEDASTLKRFFSNTDRPVFLMKHPGLLSGAFGSMHSRLGGDLRVAVADMMKKNPAVETELRQYPASVDGGFGESFFKRVFGEFGDDSIAQMVPCVPCFEGVSMVQAMRYFHHRPLAGIELSSRYKKLNKKVNGKYQYVTDPLIKEFGLQNLFTSRTDALFDLYDEGVDAKRGLGKEVLEVILKKELPFELFVSEVRKALGPHSQPATDEELEKSYKKTTAAMHLDNVRHILPLSARTMLGLLCNLQNVRDIIVNGAATPTFESNAMSELLRREAAPYFQSLLDGVDPMENTRFMALGKYKHATKMVGRDGLAAPNRDSPLSTRVECGYKIEEYADHVVLTDPKFGFVVEMSSKDSIDDIVTGVIAERHSQMTFQQAKKVMQGMNAEEKTKLVHDYAGVDMRYNRRQRPGRALECATYQISAKVPVAEVRDIRRHRIMTLLDQEAFEAEEFFVSPILAQAGDGAERVMNAYRQAQEATHRIAAEINPFVASYMVPMAAFQWMNMEVNARELHHLCELRTQPGAHVNYKRICQMVYLGAKALNPVIGETMKFVDLNTEIDYGRAIQEIRSARKQA